MIRLKVVARLEALATGFFGQVWFMTCALLAKQCFLQGSKLCHDVKEMDVGSTVHSTRAFMYKELVIV